jgi:hypothetical protein
MRFASLLTPLACGVLFQLVAGPSSAGAQAAKGPAKGAA